MTTTDVAKSIERENVKEIALQLTDISGMLHFLWVPSELFSKIVDDGIHVDGSSVGLASVNKSDLKLIPDLATFAVMPISLFPQKVARVVCDIFEPESNRHLDLDPRFVLKRTLDNLGKTLGASVKYYASSEMEYFLFRRTESGGVKLLDEGGYMATPPADAGADLRLEIVQNLRSMGILVEKHHHEVPPGKYELEFGLELGIDAENSDALRMADTLYLVKFLVRLMAAKRELVASFMPKPFHGQFGAGLHTHNTLVDSKRSQNLFYDADGSHGLSKLGLNFIGGVLTHAKALAAVTNPSVNSYKRLVPGWEAPVYISWARYNRTALIRVPPGKAMRTRIEYRPTDGTCNFYTAFAAILACGLDGVRKKIDPPEPIEENVYEMTETERARRHVDLLPESLGEALKELPKDKVIIDALGRPLYDRFLQIKTKEWRDFNVAVHEWERKRYMDV